MESTSKIVAQTMMDAYKKILEISSVNNMIRENNISNVKFMKFDLEGYKQEFSLTGKSPRLDTYVQSVDEKMAADEILFTSHSAKTNFEEIAELYSKYGSLNKVVLGIK